MTSSAVKEGDVFNWPGTGPAHNSKKPHRLVAIGIFSDGDVLFAPICTHKPGCDETCVLDAGSGLPYVVQKSYIDYSQIKRISRKSIETQIGKQVTQCQSVDDALLNKIKQGVSASDETEERCMKHFQETQRAIEPKKA